MPISIEPDKFLTRLLRGQPIEPERITTDGLRSYAAALRDLERSHLHLSGVIADATIDAPCMLSSAIEVAAAPPMLPWPLDEPSEVGLAEIRQPFNLTPAYIPFERIEQTPPGLQAPSAQKRAEALPLIRYACLLASSGPIEFRPLRVDRNRAELSITIDLEAQTITLPGEGAGHPFKVEPFARRCLLEGLNSTSWLVRHMDAIERFENQRTHDARGD